MWRAHHPAAPEGKKKYADLLKENLTSPRRWKSLSPMTDFGGFTSFPEFSPDGKKIAFVSDWNAPARYEFNVFTADWNRN